MRVILSGSDEAIPPVRPSPLTPLNTLEGGRISAFMNEQSSSHVDEVAFFRHLPPPRPITTSNNSSSTSSSMHGRSRGATQGGRTAEAVALGRLGFMPAALDEEQAAASEFSRTQPQQADTMGDVAEGSSGEDSGATCS